MSDDLSPQTRTGVVKETESLANLPTYRSTSNMKNEMSAYRVRPNVVSAASQYSDATPARIDGLSALKFLQKPYGVQTTTNKVTMQGVPVDESEEDYSQNFDRENGAAS